MPNDFKHTEARFLPNSTDSLCFQVAWMPRYRDMVIFMPTTTDERRQTKPIAYACGVMNSGYDPNLPTRDSGLSFGEGDGRGSCNTW